MSVVMPAVRSERPHHVESVDEPLEPCDVLASPLIERIAEQLQERERAEDPRVPVWFWTLTEHGPQPLRRRLHAPAWSEIATNYVVTVREALDRIMGSPPDAAQGIALWRGAPGTGKTTALRALAREWRDHADIHVIVDPEVFLGDKASYLVEVLFGTDVLGWRMLVGGALVLAAMYLVELLPSRSDAAGAMQAEAIHHEV